MSQSSLKQQAIRGTIWTIFGYGSSQVLRFGSNLILTRLLMPELFGLMALVQVFINGLYLFSDIGIRPSIIRSDRGDDPVFLNTAWTLQAIRGLALWLCCLIIALPVSKYYEDTRLLWLIPIVGLNTIISGFNSTSLASLNRHMEIGKIAIFELGTQIVSLLILIAFAWLNPTIWALVWGNLISISIKALVSHSLDSRVSNRFTWNKDAFKEISSFGKWIFLSTAMTFLASQADRILLGKFFSLEMLGVYVVAYTFSDIPRQISLKISSKVIYPAIAQQIGTSNKKLKVKIVQQRWKLLAFTIVILSFLFCFGDMVILTLYDSRYEQAAWILPILALGLWPLILCATIDRYLMVIGKPIYLATGNFFKFIYMLVCIPVGFEKMGILGAVIVITFNDIPYYLAVQYGLLREKIMILSQDFKASILLVLAIALLLTMRFIAGWEIPIDIFREAF